MSPAALRAALIAVVVPWAASACDPRPSTTMPTIQTKSAWAASNGLEVQLELPAKPVTGAAAGQPDPAVATLRFRNASQQPLRFYLIQSEPFRSFQSSLSVHSGEDGGAPISVQPDPRPHGYVVTENDFHLLAPGEEKSFTQSLYVARVARGGQGVERLPGFAGGGTFRVRWTYENRVTQWQGGAQTLDGTTQPLFGGGPIPHIWTGKVQAEAMLQVEAP